MSSLNNSNDDVHECPLCMEPLEVDDLNFYPCTCGYQICRFCWHRIRTDENELCPACRKAYPENPADFTPLSQEQIAALKAEKRQRDQQRKQKITENRKHLANVRVVQKNLVFVVGLPPRLADADILKKHEYFGKYGKIHKVVINPSTTYAGVQGPSASAYVTYVINNDALRAIQSVNNIMIDGRLIKTSLGTTKYCSHFMKNQQCPKPDCMYLHELGDSEASFTKEEMHQGKHQEYEKRLHEALNSISSTTNGTSVTPNGTTGSNGKIHDEIGSIFTTAKTNQNGSSNKETNNKEAWPSLATSPVNGEKSVKSNKSGSQNNKENSSTKTKHKAEKTKGNKNNQQKNSNMLSPSDNKHQQRHKLSNSISADEEVNLIATNIENGDNSSLENGDGKETDSSSLSSTPSSNTEGDSGSISESMSGKSSPGNSEFPDHPSQIQSKQSVCSNEHTNISNSLETHSEKLGEHSVEILHKKVSESDDDEKNSKIDSESTNGSVDKTTARLNKLNLYDGSSSLFSGQMNSYGFNNGSDTSPRCPHLPDLLNGTESDKDRHELELKWNLLKNYNNGHHFNQFVGLNENNCDDIEAALKMVMHQKQLDQQEEMRKRDLQKRNYLNNIYGMSQTNNLRGGPLSDHEFFHNGSIDMNRMTNGSTSHIPSQNNMINDNSGHVYSGNMSKFFDFHKNQQMQQQQQQQQQQQYHNGMHMNDQIKMPNLLENSSLLNSTQYYDQKRLYNNSSSNHNMMVNNSQPTRLPNHFAGQNNSVDDDLGFDPFIETQKGLAELMENEINQQHTQNNNSKLMENCQRSTRMPPPGFNHMNAFGFGAPRNQGSKMMPFMGGNQQNSGNWTQQQQQQPQQPSANSHMGFGQPGLDHMSQQQQQANKSGFGSMTDWTALDPAIVSFRQFPFKSSPMNPTPQTQPQHPLYNTGDMLMSHHQQQNHNMHQGGYGHHGMNMQNSHLNQQQNSPGMMNLQMGNQHNNWLNAGDQQNLLLNNLTNGFSNNYDKFSIPLPPGFANTVAGNNKQKPTECIN